MRGLHLLWGDRLRFRLSLLLHRCRLEASFHSINLRGYIAFFLWVQQWCLLRCWPFGKQRLWSFWGLVSGNLLDWELWWDLASLLDWRFIFFWSCELHKYICFPLFSGWANSLLLLLVVWGRRYHFDTVLTVPWLDFSWYFLTWSVPLS